MDKTGCPQDVDGDGVPYYKDRCPFTPPRIKVDAYGCPKEFNITAVFKPDSEGLKPESFAYLLKCALFLSNNTEYSVVIPKPVLFSGLERKRFYTVYETLLKHGVKKDQIIFLKTKKSFINGTKLTLWVIKQ